MPFVFANMEFLWLLAILPLLAAWYVWRLRKQAAVSLSIAGNLPQPAFFSLATLLHVLFALRLIAIGLIIMAMARPQQSFGTHSVNSEGIDIVLALDVSGSMLQRDFKPNRMEAAKQVADSFIAGRPNDRIGLILFASEAYTACPITIDHKVLRKVLKGVGAGDISGGTAIGLGLATAVRHLQVSHGKSKVLILMTDGENNTGHVKPMLAAEMAKSLDVKVYTIGIELAPKKTDSLHTTVGISPSGEFLLKEIARGTQGQYFSATNERGLAMIYDQINRLEKTKVDVSLYTETEELFYPLVLLAALILCVEVLLRYTLLKTLP